MARPQTEFDPAVMASAIADWRAGVLTQMQISKRYGIPYKTLGRRLAGIAQDGLATTRALVAAQVSGVPNKEIDAAVSDKVGRSVALASEAMLDADAIFRSALKLVKSDLERGQDGGADPENPKTVYTPKQIRDLVGAAKDAMEGVRRVRELDGPAENPLKELFAQLGASAALRPQVDA